jgi:hypothetical protein
MQGLATDLKWSIEIESCDAAASQDIHCGPGMRYCCTPRALGQAPR